MLVANHESGQGYCFMAYILYSNPSFSKVIYRFKWGINLFMGHSVDDTNTIIDNNFFSVKWEKISTTAFTHNTV